MAKKVFLVLATIILVFLTVACDGGDGGSWPTRTPRPTVMVTPSTTDLWKKIWAGGDCPLNWNDPDLGLPDRCNGITTPAPTRPAGN